MIEQKNTIKCLVVDDEPLAQKILQDYISQIEYLKLVALCDNVIEAEQHIISGDIDLIFLDIEMPGISGVEFVKNMKIMPAFVFTTAHENYALEGYELDTLDYLLKPFSFERFFKSISKYKRKFGKTLSANENDFQKSKTFDEAFIYVKTAGKMVKLYLKDILYFESLRNYLRIVTHDKTVLTHKTISEFEERLPDGNFIRVHRSFLISKNNINAFTSSEIEIAGHKIPIGRNYREFVLNTLTPDIQLF